MYQIIAKRLFIQQLSLCWHNKDWQGNIYYTIMPNLYRLPLPYPSSLPSSLLSSLILPAPEYHCISKEDRCTHPRCCRWEVAAVTISKGYMSFLHIYRPLSSIYHYHRALICKVNSWDLTMLVVRMQSEHHWKIGKLAVTISKGYMSFPPTFEVDLSETGLNFFESHRYLYILLLVAVAPLSTTTCVATPCRAQNTNSSPLHDLTSKVTLAMFKTAKEQPIPVEGTIKGKCCYHCTHVSSLMHLGSGLCHVCDMIT